MKEPTSYSSDEAQQLRDRFEQWRRHAHPEDFEDYRPPATIEVSEHDHPPRLFRRSSHPSPYVSRNRTGTIE